MPISTSPAPPDRPAASWLAYVAPLAVFSIFTSLEGAIGGLLSRGASAEAASGASPGYPWAYAIKIAAVSLAAWLSRSAWRDLRPRPRPVDLLLSVLIGLAVTAVWVGLHGRYPLLLLGGERAAFDPGSLDGAGRLAFLILRFYGLVLVVPLVEELFWRDLAMRWIVHPRFETVPIGRVTPLAALATSALFALTHPEWLPAFLTGLAWAWLLLRTRSVSACVISHLVANLALGIYVLRTGAWWFW